MSRESIQKIEIREGNRIITTQQQKYFLKRKKHFHQEEIYRKLEERGFHHFLKPMGQFQQEEVFPYIEEKHYRKEEKAIDMINVLSLLQNKTTFYQEIVLDEVKDFYESKKREIEYLKAYYHDLEEYFFKEIYPSPSVYLFQRNLSLLFSSLFTADETLDVWYQEMTSQKYQRQVLVHGKFSLSHLLEGEIPLLISLEQMKYGSPVVDLVTFIKAHCLELDISSLYHIYEQKYPLRKEEWLLLVVFLTIPPKLEIFSSYENTVEISKNFQKMNCYRLFLLKENERHQHKKT